MAEESEDELEMLVEYDEEFSDSTTEDEGSEDDGELGEFEDGGDGENAQNDGQNAQNDNEEPAVVDGDAAVAAIIQGGPVKLDSMWQHRLTRLVRDRYMYSIRITV